MTAQAAVPVPLTRVAVGVLTTAENRVLVARRAPHQHQGDLWEFPGGKIEPGESLAEALAREFAEEVGLELDVPVDLSPWQVIEHDYGDRQVRLEVARIGAFAGEASGREGQEVRWMTVQTLDPADFPAANAPIIEALQAESA